VLVVAIVAVAVGMLVAVIIGSLSPRYRTRRCHATKQPLSNPRRRQPCTGGQLPVPSTADQ
jgi:hypothetical protein